MTTTPRLALPLLAAGQAQKHVTHNDALVRLDALVHLVVESRSQNVAPVVPAAPAAFIVPEGASGIWAGKADQLAIFEDEAWTYLLPRPGWQAWIADEAEHHVWTGSQWRRSSPISSLGASVWGVNATADETTRLAVAADASLFNHAGSDHRLCISKASEAGTASVIFQDGFSGRAEFGLTGDDQFHLKVSADGTAWTEALNVDRASGLISLPASPWARETARKNLLVNGDMQVNQRNFGGGALAAGAYGFDRWKAGSAGAGLSRSGFDIALASGAIIQLVEPALWGVASFAQVPLCLSVEDLSGGSLSVALGSAHGTIAPGSGRCAVALTPAAGDTGALAVQLAPASGAVSFRRVKLEFGTGATPWDGRPLTEERALCERYYWRPEATIFIDLYQNATGYHQQVVSFPTRMRVTPAASYTVSLEANIYAGQRSITGASPNVAIAAVRAANTGEVYAQFSDIAFNAEL